MVNDAGGTDMKALLAVMRRLRDRDNGCPWDVAQDFNSIAPYTIEEAYEVADAIARDHMPDLAAELRARSPTLRVLFMSGYVGEMLDQHEGLLDEGHFLAKPFTVRELEASVRAVLDGDR